MKEKQAVIRATQVRYRKAGKKEKKAILDEFVALTGYNRKYASGVLSQKTEKVPKKKQKRVKSVIYDQAVLSALVKVWAIMDCICGKRLAPMLREIVPILESSGEIVIPQAVKEKLLTISPATIDRLLAVEKERFQLKGKSYTKPGTLLKHQVPVRTFTQWPEPGEQTPGFMEIDLVGHEGGNASGDFAFSLNMTDVCTGWTETVAVRNKAQRYVFEGLKDIRDRLPYPLLGIDSDNGSEFINYELVRYCKQNKITFTRSRSGKKNDNCYVEQKNYSIVRKAVGYYRYDTEQELLLLNQLYGHLRLYINYFQPVMKLVGKTRDGARVKKTYDKARTPYRRLLDQCDEDTKKLLQQEYTALNPAALKREISKIQEELEKIAVNKSRKGYAISYADPGNRIETGL